MRQWKYDATVHITRPVATFCIQSSNKVQKTSLLNRLPIRIISEGAEILRISLDGMTKNTLDLLSLFSKSFRALKAAAHQGDIFIGTKNSIS